MKTEVMVLGALVGGVALYVLAKKKPGESIGAAVGREIVGAAGDAAAGAVVGIGHVFGIPATNQDQCSADLAAGRTWDASFSCPASRFVGGVFSSTTTSSADRADAEKVDAYSAWDSFGNYTQPAAPVVQQPAVKPSAWSSFGNYTNTPAANWTGGATGTW